MTPPFVSLLINGTKLVRCAVPEGDEESSVELCLAGLDPPSAALPRPNSTTSTAITKPDARFPQQEFGYKISCVLSMPSSGTTGPTSTAGTDSFTLCDTTSYDQWEGTLRLDCATLPLGSVSRERLVAHSVGVVPTRPTAATLAIVKRLGAIPGDPASGSSASIAQKARLLACVREALADDKINPRQGSLPAALIEEKALQCGCFEDVVRMYDLGFIGFIEAHSDDFTLFNYTQDEIEGRDMEEHAHTKELRIVLKKGKRVQFCSEAEEQELLDLLKSVLSAGDLTCDELLLKIHEAGVGFSISPCFSQLMRFLSRNTDLFSWSTDPSQITTVSFSAQSAREPMQKRLEGAGGNGGGGGGGGRDSKHTGSKHRHHNKHACIHPVSHGAPGGQFRGNVMGNR